MKWICFLLAILATHAAASQTTRPAKDITGKWMAKKLQIEQVLTLDADQPDSTYQQFLRKEKSGVSMHAMFALPDSVSLETFCKKSLLSMKDHYFELKADKTFISNIKYDDVSHLDKGSYRYNEQTAELQLGQDVFRILSFDGSTLSLIAVGRDEDDGFPILTFGKAKF